MEGLWFALAFVAVVVFVLGLFSRRMDQRFDEEDARLQSHYEALSDNRKADQLLDDPDHVERLRDKYND